MTDRDVVAAQVEEVLGERVRPMLKSHGGGIAVREIDPTGVVRLDWLGACTGCPLRPLTTTALIQPELEAIDGVSEVDTGFRVSRAAAERLARIARG